MLKFKSVNFNHQLFQEHTLTQVYAGQLEWLVGRDPRCHLVLTTLDVSRMHGRIFFQEGTYYFENISQHGSTLNREELLPNDCKPFKKGDLLMVGETYLHVEEVDDPLADPVNEPVVDGVRSPIHSEQEWWTTGDLWVRCCQIIDETTDVKTFCFTADPPLLFQYRPGQFVTLELDMDGETVLRPYSISSSPTRPYHLAITIKRVGSPGDRPELPPGRVSNWMHDRFGVGDRLKLRGLPLGNFTCVPEVPPKVLLLSAGSGITPLMSMARWLQDTLTPCDIVFLHSARTPQDIIFHSELALMAAQMPHFRLALTVTQPPATCHWAGFTGRIDADLLKRVAPDLMERTVYACGADGWRQAMKTGLEQMGFPMQAYREESFGGYQPAKITPVSASEAIQRTMENTHPVTPRARVMTLDRTTLNMLSPQSSNGKVPKEETENRTAETQKTTLLKPPSGNSAIAVYFAQSGTQVPAEGNLTLLELAEQAGVSIPCACRSGNCGACKVRLQQGKVRYDQPPAALSEADQKAGYALACVAYPTERVVVDL
ncbi:MAG: 2Fe-2S iron-sulfur cluster-binding protein [Oculatellaceae cyanobacterium Prado106]|jgi:ferredoxin-NADP reductase/ferredoxin|nr:2Fe-2S iron-sulfur cluster-binding protein [Oculatellaceae cyanobacterium Prado106]